MSNPSHSPPPPARPPRPLCRFFFVTNSCRFGDECLYSHTLPEGIATKEEALKFIPCPYFRNGNCKYGSHCQLQHDPETENVSSPILCENTKHHDDQDTITCGICLEEQTIGTTIFGILNCACQNAYCHKCIMEWRTEGFDEAADRTCCPSCRQKISYVFPSLILPQTVEEKEKIIQEYTDKVGRVPCKFFDGNLGSCQYGRDCMYAHLDEDGNDCKKMDLSMEHLYQTRRIAFLRQRAHTQHMDWLYDRFVAYMAFGNEDSDDEDEDYEDEDYDDDDDDDDDDYFMPPTNIDLLRMFLAFEMME